MIQWCNQRENKTAREETERPNTANNIVVVLLLARTDTDNIVFDVYSVTVGASREYS